MPVVKLPVTLCLPDGTVLAAGQSFVHLAAAGTWGGTISQITWRSADTLLAGGDDLLLEPDGRPALSVRVVRSAVTECGPTIVRFEGVGPQPDLK